MATEPGPCYLVVKIDVVAAFHPRTGRKSSRPVRTRQKRAGAFQPARIAAFRRPSALAARSGRPAVRRCTPTRGRPRRWSVPCRRAPTRRPISGRATPWLTPPSEPPPQRHLGPPVLSRLPLDAARGQVSDASLVGIVPAYQQIAAPDCGRGVQQRGPAVVIGRAFRQLDPRRLGGGPEPPAPLGCRTHPLTFLYRSSYSR